MITVIISPGQLRIYQRLTFILAFIMIIVGILTILSVALNGLYMLLFNLPLSIVIPYILFRDYKNCQSISYDNEAVFIGKDELHTIKISFDNIRSLTIGMYDFYLKIHLDRPMNGAKFFMLKLPVFWWPSGKRTLRESIYHLKQKIEAYKKSGDEDHPWDTPIIERLTLKI